MSSTSTEKQQPPTRPVAFRANAWLRTALAAEAERRGKTVSDYCREVIARAIERANT